MSSTVALGGFDVKTGPNWVSLATRRLAIFAALEPRRHAGWWGSVDREMSGCTYEAQLGRLKLVLTRKPVTIEAATGAMLADQA